MSGNHVVKANESPKKLKKILVCCYHCNSCCPVAGVGHETGYVLSSCYNVLEWKTGTGHTVISFEGNHLPHTNLNTIRRQVL